MTTKSGIISANCIIPSGATTSNAVSTGGGPLVGIYAPAMTGTSLTFTAASTEDSTTFYPVRDQLGNLITVTLNAAQSFYSLRSVMPFGMDLLRVVSSSAEGAERTITPVFQQVV